MELFRLLGSIFVDNKEANDSIEETNEKAEKTGVSFGQVAKKIGVGMTAVGTAAVGAGLAVFKFTKNASDQLDVIDKQSQKLGLSREAYQEWGYILDQNGADITMMESGLKAMTNQMDMALEGNEKAIDSFAKLGITQEMLATQSREEIFKSTISGLQEMANEADKAATANVLLGRGGVMLMPLLNQTAEATDELRDKAHRLGMVLSDDTVAAGASFSDALGTITMTLQKAMISVIAPLIPTVTKLIEKLADIIPPLMDFIAPLIDKLLPVFGILVEKLLPVFLRLMDSLLPVLGPLLDVFLVLVDLALIPLLDILIMLIENVLPVVANMFEILTPILTPILELMGRLGEFIMPVVVRILEALLPVLEPLLVLFLELAEMVLPLTLEMFEFLIPILEPVMEVILRLAESVIPILLNAFEKIMPIVKPIMDIFGAYIRTFMALLSGDWAGAWEGFKSIFTNAWAGIKALFNGVLGFIKDLFLPAWEGLWGAVTNTFKNIWESMKEIFKAPINWIIGGINSFIEGINKIKIPDWVPGVGGKGLNLSTIPQLKDGGTILKGGTALVGEAGPELLHLPKGATVEPLQAQDNDEKEITVVNYTILDGKVISKTTNKGQADLNIARFRAEGVLA